MAANHLPDVNIAVQNFLKHFGSLSRLPFITDSEMDQLFGEEVSAVLQELERYNRQEKLCRTCRSRCCLLVDCELYVPELSCCPVYELRPLLCRMHFCNSFTLYKEEVKAVGDIFLESLLAGEHIVPEEIKLLDSPPLGTIAPQLIAGIKPLLTAFKPGRFDECSTLKSIAEICKSWEPRNNHL